MQTSVIKALQVEPSKMKTPDCSICNTKFDYMELLNNHMQKRHLESPNDRMDRLTMTIQESIDSEKSENGLEVTKNRENTEDMLSCNLCDKPFGSKGPLINHMLLVHTVRTKEIHCDFCDEIFYSKKILCSHISSEHSEYFVKQEDTTGPEDFSEEKEDGEVNPDVVVIEEEPGHYKEGSWGPKGEEDKDGYSFQGKKKQFAQAALEVQKLFFTNKEYQIDGVKFALES